ncbi:MAG: hypothetical protein RLY70_1409, partial [Planctomycetota bacterium]
MPLRLGAFLRSRFHRFLARRAASRRRLTRLRRERLKRLEVLEIRRLLAIDVVVQPGQTYGDTGTYIQNTVDTYTQQAGGRLQIEIGSASQFDRLAVGGNVALDGTLEVKLVGGFEPAVGTAFTFIAASNASVSGKFADTLGMFAFPSGDRYFDITSTASGLNLEVKATPGGLNFAPLAAQRDRFAEFLGSYYTTPQFAYSGSFSAAGFADISGTFGLVKSGAAIQAAGTASVAMNAGSASVGLANAPFGFVITAANKVAFEAAGTPVFTNTGFDSVTASAARFRYNNTSTAYTGQSVSAAGNGYTFASLPAASDLRVFSIDSLDATIGDSLRVSGDFNFQSQNGDIRAIASNAAARLQAGASLSAGVSSAVAALSLNADGTRQVYANGAFALSGGSVAQASGTATVVENTATSATSARDIMIDGTTVSLPAMTASTRRVAGTVSMSMLDFVHVSGGVTIEQSPRTLTLTDGSTVAVDVLTIGGNNLSGFTGIDGPASNPDAAGLSLANLKLGAVLAAPRDSQGGSDLRTWTATRATAATATFVSDGSVTGNATNITVGVNQARGTLGGNSANVAANFSGSPLTIAAGDGTTTSIDFSQAALSAATTATITAGSFLEMTGGWAFTKTNKDGVERLEAGVANATAFVGNNRGQANESGVKVTEANLGLVMVERTAPATAKYALSGSGAVSLVGVTGLQLSGTASVQVNRMDAAVNESITTPGGAVAVVFPSAVAVTRVSGT